MFLLFSYVLPAGACVLCTNPLCYGDPWPFFFLLLFLLSQEEKEDEAASCLISGFII
jgi:hypothetical protein